MLQVCTELSCVRTFIAHTHVSLADRAVGRHRPEIREAMIKLLELPIPESYKAGSMVIEAVLGRSLTD